MHVPVLLAEAIDLLAAAGDGRYVDATVGLGGHAEALLERSSGTALLGIDRDAEALALARERLERFGPRVQLIEGRFGNVESLARGAGFESVRGVIADLGVSSLQLGAAERGFAFSLDGPLDMRMGDGELTAREIVNGYREEDLRKIFKEYGEEPRARRIARAIVDERRRRPLETTGELARLIERVKPASARRPRSSRQPRGRRHPGAGRGLHPATQVFQALRIEVNRELEELEALLAGAVRLLEKEGRLVVISYHSLEDRIVKNTLRDLATGEIEPVTGRPRSETRVIEVLTKKPLRPGEGEIAINPRSRSARLRAARRL